MSTGEQAARKSNRARRSKRDADEAAAEVAKDRRQRIAEAAYYNAERRGFAGNLQLEDWLEAERQIDSRASSAGIQNEASVLAEGAGDVSAPAIKENRTNASGETIEPDRLKEWAKKLKVPASRLREAIASVGPAVDDVRRFLESDSASE